MSASLAAAGYNRTPIDDEDDFGSRSGMRQRFNSMGSRPTISTPITEEERAAEAAAVAHHYDPYADFGRPVGGISGYAPVRSDSPSQHGRDSSYSSGTSRPAGSVSAPRPSTGSTDPLLTGMAGPPQGPPEYIESTPVVPLRSPRRLADAKVQPSQPVVVSYSARGSDGRSSFDDRLDPALTSSQTERTDSQDLRDDVDYSRPVLEVCRVVVTVHS